ncbi:MAG: EI24 domain-containing protein, partial [Pseudomonadota bacterium]
WGMLAVALLVSILVMIPLASLLVGLFVEDVAQAVEDRHYPHLPPAAGQGWGEMIWDTVRFLTLMIIVNAFALVIYFAATVFAPFVFLAVNGLLLGREYFYLVAARRVGVPEARRLFRRNFVEVWLTGILMAVPLTVPVLNLLVPVLGVATFTHQYHRLTGEGRGDTAPR